MIFALQQALGNLALAVLVLIIIPWASLIGLYAGIEHLIQSYKHHHPQPEFSTAEIRQIRQLED